VSSPNTAQMRKRARAGSRWSIVMNRGGPCRRAPRLAHEYARYTAASALPLNALAADTQDNNWVRVNAYPGADGFIINGVIGASTQAQMQIVDTWTWSRLVRVSGAS
jgi:hypothetical protein